LRAVIDDPDGMMRGPVTTAELFALVAHAAASGGVHGRRRGGAAGRSHAWWVARCATGLERDTAVDPDALEYLLEDVARIAARSPQGATWRLEIALGAPSSGGADDDPSPAGQAAGEWAVAIAAFDREDPATGPADPYGPSGPPGAMSPGRTAPW
jgi:hypothetical protein